MQCKLKFFKGSKQTIVFETLRAVTGIVDTGRYCHDDEPTIGIAIKPGEIFRCHREL